MSKIIILFISLLSSISLMAKEKVQVSTSEQDAKIYANGILVGNGRAEVVVEKNQCVELSIQKVGFLTIERTYCNKKGFAEPPKIDFFKMEIDEAFTSSISTDLANRDIEIKTDKSDADSWRSISQIVTSYFDVIEVADKDMGYMRTAWSSQSFKSGIIRTRVIIKLGSSSPLIYKVKLVSEYSIDPRATVKADEAFKEWDRLLRKYQGVVVELQSRLSKR